MIGYLKNMVTGGNRPKVSRGDVLQSRPVRNPAIVWNRESGENGAASLMLLKMPRRSDHWGNIVAKLMKLPDFRKLELDEIGSDVWEMCDGDTSVEAITRGIVIKYHLNRRQAETSVTAYLRQLAERRLIAVRTGGKGSVGKTSKARPSGAGSKAKQQA